MGQLAGNYKSRRLKVELRFYAVILLVAAASSVVLKLIPMETLPGTRSSNHCGQQQTLECVEPKVSLLL